MSYELCVIFKFVNKIEGNNWLTIAVSCTYLLSPAFMLGAKTSDIAALATIFTPFYGKISHGKSRILPYCLIPSINAGAKR
jgi:hypothetical protein